MIGLLRGQVVSQSPPYLVMDVNGVGYELQAPMTTFYQLADPEPLLALSRCDRGGGGCGGGRYLALSGARG